mgnify:CR=1 FL=1
MNSRSALLILMCFLCMNSYGGIYKCVNNNGKMSFQQKPCDINSEKSEEINIDPQTKGGPVKLTKENKKQYSIALQSHSMEVTARECRARNSSYADEVQQASDRLYQIRKIEIDAGKEILRRGFVGLSASEIASSRNEGKRNLRSKLAKMSKKELDRFCDSQARKARNLAASASKRSSGYLEGDIDPEGND